MTKDKAHRSSVSIMMTMISIIIDNTKNAVMTQNLIHSSKTRAKVWASTVNTI